MADPKTTPEQAKAAAGVEVRAQATQANAEKANKLMNETQPTPTQRENDLAKVGIQTDDKEDDGSGPDPNAAGNEAAANLAAGKPTAEPQKRAAAQNEADAGYKTREASKKP